MVVSKQEIHKIIENYDPKKITIATVCSHSALQTFYGARQEGFRTLGIAIGSIPKFYDAFPKAKPDEFLVLNNYAEILDKADELINKNVILIPNGSFVEYMGAETFRDKLKIPTFGNRKVLSWESDRNKQREWLEGGGVRMPAVIKNPEDIKNPVIVKYFGAKGGRGFFVAKNKEEFYNKIGSTGQKFTMQEYILGTRYYPQFFASPFKRNNAMETKSGSVQLMSIDRRDETNIDEMYKMGTIEDMRKQGFVPSFVVTGNVPVVLRESLLPEIFDFAEKTCDKAKELFDGMIGPFCLEGVYTDQLKFYVFEISGRIVAGTNPFISGSPYSALAFDKPMSTGRRIAEEIRYAISINKLKEVIS
jgi:5-formaminoimidazole-4-carboxamide-1-(beta)-D-ribofuranosyl 5'-monophosphate synthetase